MIIWVDGIERTPPHVWDQQDGVVGNRTKGPMRDRVAGNASPCGQLTSFFFQHKLINLEAVRCRGTNRFAAADYVSIHRPLVLKTQRRTNILVRRVPLSSVLCCWGWLTPNHLADTVRHSWLLLRTLANGRTGRQGRTGNTVQHPARLETCCAISSSECPILVKLNNNKLR